MGLKEVPDFTLASDTTVTPPRAQYPAMVSKAQKRKPPRYAGFANACNTRQRIIITLNEQVSGSSPLVGSLQCSLTPALSFAVPWRLVPACGTRDQP